MSQGLYNEEEIRDELSKCFNLNLSREALMRPTKEFVVDIYSRFLDDIKPKWRKKTEGTDIPLKPLIVVWLKHILAPYNINYTPDMYDLLTPKKDRFIAYINVLLYVKALMDDARDGCQHLNEEWHLKRKQIDEVRLRLAEIRRAQDELAVRESEAKEDEPKIEQKNAEAKRAFKQVEAQSELFDARKSEIKESITTIKEKILREEVNIQTGRKRIEEAQKYFNLRNEESRLIEETPRIDHEKAKLSQDLQIVHNRLQSELHQIEATIEDFKEDVNRDIIQTVKDSEELKLKRQKASEKRRMHAEKCQAALAEANKQLDDFTKPNDLSREIEKVEQIATAALLKSQRKYQSLFGTKEDESETQADRTYIKNPTVISQR